MLVRRGRVRDDRSSRERGALLHAASVIALVDSACGYGCLSSLPEGARGFTTIENGGRTTQVWDAEAVHEQTGKTIALFRCTQMLLYPRS